MPRDPGLSNDARDLDRQGIAMILTAFIFLFAFLIALQVHKHGWSWVVVGNTAIILSVPIGGAASLVGLFRLLLSTLRAVDRFRFRGRR